MKLFKRFFLGFLLVSFLSVISFQLFIVPRYTVPILMYHSIGGCSTGNNNHVSLENFTKHMRYIKSRGYQVISLAELVERIKNKKPINHNLVVITFDDGHQDNYISAFPLLKEYGFPATIFIITGEIGREGFLTWAQTKEMFSTGIDIGAHTRNEVYLPGLSGYGALGEEIRGPLKDIKNNIGYDAKYFSYPTGGFNEEIKRLVKEAGYQGACTTNRGKERKGQDVYELKRVKMTNADTTLWWKPFALRVKLSGYYNVFRRVKDGH
jgi:peptidoglycan/xylan/chitin deacetylase (PgdA/CDA1 family)